MTQAIAGLLRTKVEVLLSTSDDYVEQVEATAHLDQKVLVSNKRLPREIERTRFVTWPELCRRWGMRVYGAPDADYFAVEMPTDWNIQPVAQDSLWSLVLDARGRERASVYHQANVFDHSAIFYLLRRFNIFSHYLDPTDSTVRIISGRDERRIFREFGRVEPDDPRYFQEVPRIERQARAWFDQEYPGWREPFAYWELEP